ncbi:MAG TPA: hypothetical protein VGB25_05100 [Candidatus Binatia bacterium]
MRFRRSATLSLLLLAAIAFVGMRTYQFWMEPLIAGPDLLGKPAEQGATMGKPRASRPRPYSVDSILRRNLFDPERGSGAADKKEPQFVDARLVQSFVLVGTMITPETRRALLKVPPTLDEDRGSRGAGANGGPVTQPREIRRVDLGDELGGFELASVEPGKVIFVKDSERIELVLDFTHGPVDTPGPAKAAVPAKRKAPRKNPPRRARRG